MASKLPWLNVNVFACKISHNATSGQLTENIIFLQLPSHAKWLACVILTCYKYFNSFLWYLTSYGFFFSALAEELEFGNAPHRIVMVCIIALLLTPKRIRFVCASGQRKPPSRHRPLSYWRSNFKTFFSFSVISLSNLVVMRRIQRKIDTKVRPVGVINIKIKE